MLSFLNNDNVPHLGVGTGAEKTTTYPTVGDVVAFFDYSFFSEGDVVVFLNDNVPWHLVWWSYHITCPGQAFNAKWQTIVAK